VEWRQRVLARDRLARELLAVVAPADLDDQLRSVAGRVDKDLGSRNSASGSGGFWKVKVVQKATELRGLLLFLWREVALLDNLDHLIERTPPPPLAYSPRREGCAVSLGRNSISPTHTSTSPPLSSGARASREGPRGPTGERSQQRYHHPPLKCPSHLPRVAVPRRQDRRASTTKRS
jgi:hypothetical protein